MIKKQRIKDAKELITLIESYNKLTNKNYQKQYSLVKKIRTRCNRLMKWCSGNLDKLVDNERIRIKRLEELRLSQDKRGK